MEYITIILIAVALSLDAFSVAITCGLKLKNFIFRKYLKISLSFAFFQAFMPILGWINGLYMHAYVNKYASLITFLVFFILALKSFYEYLKSHNCDNIQYCNCKGFNCLFVLSFATSIDAFLMGFVISFFEINFYFALAIIGFITLNISLLGCLVGNRSNTIFQKKAHLLSGLILFLLSIKSFF